MIQERMSWLLGGATQEQHKIPVNCVLSDRGTEYCGALGRHEYGFYLVVETIDHTRTKARQPAHTRLAAGPVTQYLPRRSLRLQHVAPVCFRRT